MEKVVLTKEQAEFVEKYKAVRGLAEKLDKAVSEGYVIESEFKAGDKLHSPIIGILNVISCSGRVVSVKEFSYPLPADEYRIATPEEIYWLETLGREKVGDFRIGDIILSAILIPYVVRYDSDGLTRVSKSTALKMYENKELFSIYPADSEKQLPQEEK